QAFVVTDGTVPRREIGTARWVDGKVSFDVVQAGPDVAQRYVVVPGVVHRLALRPVSEGWERTADADLPASERDYLAMLGRRLDPSLRYPGLESLQVTRGKPRTVNGVKCWPYVVRTTVRESLESMPEGARWD